MLKDIKNSFDFFLRNKIRISRKNFSETNQKLIERNTLENQYTKDVMEQCFTKRRQKTIKALDIGSKNWFYAKGEYKFFESFSKEFSLDGVELDAYRLYSNFYNRYEVAKYYTKGLKNAKYIVGDLLDVEDKYDYIIWFLPFVLYEPHSYWGLPKKYFYPEKLLKHAHSLLQTNGQMLIINQGEIEAKIQQEMLEKLGISYKSLGEIKSEKFSYKNKRFGFLVEKTQELTELNTTIN